MKINIPSEYPDSPTVEQPSISFLQLQGHSNKNGPESQLDNQHEVNELLPKIQEIAKLFKKKQILGPPAGQKLNSPANSKQSSPYVMKPRTPTAKSPLASQQPQTPNLFLEISGLQDSTSKQPQNSSFSEFEEKKEWARVMHPESGDLRSPDLGTNKRAQQFSLARNQVQNLRDSGKTSFLSPTISQLLKVKEKQERKNFFTEEAGKMQKAVLFVMSLNKFMKKLSKRREKNQIIQKELLKLVQELNLTTSVSSDTDVLQIPYTSQVDLDLYSHQNLVKREKLKGFFYFFSFSIPFY